MEFDFLKVMFIVIVNSLLIIQGFLLDWMEIIEVNGYMVEEKIEIVKCYLLFKQLEVYGIFKVYLFIDKKVFEVMIECYINESGVCGFDKKLVKLVWY